MSTLLLGQTSELFVFQLTGPCSMDRTQLLYCAVYFLQLCGECVQYRTP